MSMHSDFSVPDPKSFKMSFILKLVFLVFIVLGAVGLYLLFLEDATRAWFNYLIGSVLFLGMGLFGLFFTIINHVVGAKWMVSLRRVCESMSMTIPVAGLLMVGVCVGIHQMFEWSHLNVVANDPLLQEKAGYLNANAFIMRMILYFVVWIGSMFVLVRNSFKQDKSNDAAALAVKARRVSAFALILFALSVSFAGFDLLMSLEPHWFSTIYGVYFFAGFFQAGLACMYLIVASLYRSGVLKDFVTEYHFHDLGKFVFAFSIFWAYIGFSQYMLYWYGNLPEETFWYMERTKDGWQWVGLAVLLIRWALPFLILLPYRNKMNFKIAVPICFLVIFGQWLDLYWNAMPASRLMAHSAEAGHEVAHYGAMFSAYEVMVGVGFFALFLLVAGSVMERIKMVPTGDPRISDSVHHHGH